MSRAERGDGAAPGDGEGFQQHDVVEVEGSRHMANVVQPLVDLDGPASSIEAAGFDTIMADTGRVEDAPQTDQEEMVVTPLVRSEEEVGSGHAEGVAQAHMGKGIPPPSMVAANMPVPIVTKGWNVESISLTVAPVVLL